MNIPYSITEFRGNRSFQGNQMPMHSSVKRGLCGEYRVWRTIENEFCNLLYIYSRKGYTDP